MSLTKQDFDYSSDDLGEAFPPHRSEPRLPSGFHSGLIEWELDKALEDYRHENGDEGLMEKIELYVTERGLY